MTDNRLNDNLLGTAAMILRNSGYVTKLITVPELTASLLLAENQNFLLASAAAPTLAEMLRMEKSASIEVANLVARAVAGPKQLDTYLVLLTPDQSPEDKQTVAALFAINYNTRYLRRLVNVGISPTEDSLRRALKTFLPPPRVTEFAKESDPLAHLEKELLRHGITIDDAADAVASFRATGLLYHV